MTADSNTLKDKINEWLINGHTGISSKTIASVALGVTPKEPCHPWDRSDFGRCLELLDRVPEIRPQLDLVAKEYPEWKYLVEEWDHLTDLYLSGNSDSVIEQMSREMGYLINKGSIFSKQGDEGVSAYVEKCSKENFTINTCLKNGDARDFEIGKYKSICNFVSGFHNQKEGKVLILWETADGPLLVEGIEKEPNVVETDEKSNVTRAAAIIDNLPANASVGSLSLVINDKYHWSKSNAVKNPLKPRA